MNKAKTNKGPISIFSFFSEARDEIKKVTWPEKKQIIQLTTLVIVSSAIVGIYLGGIDYVFTALLGFILNK